MLSYQIICVRENDFNIPVYSSKYQKIPINTLVKYEYSLHTLKIIGINDWDDSTTTECLEDYT